ncbi:MAG: MFS transporter [Candidatus Limnocylindria bacterium]
MTPRERRTLLGVLGFLTFASVYANVVIVPALVLIAGEFGTTTGTAGLVAAAYGVPGIAVALLVGPYSDKLGRKWFLIAGSVLMGGATLLSAFAQTFEILIATRALAGMGASVIFPNVNATIGDSFPYRERGRAISNVIAMNTMASIIGLPVAGIVAEATSWRVSVGGVGIIAIGAAVLLFKLLANTRPEVQPARARDLYGQIGGNVSAVAALGSSLLGALFWFTWATFFIVFFQQTYALSLGAASTVGLTLGVGVLVGSQVGGRLGDRIGHRRVIAVSILIAGALLLLQTNVSMPLALAATLNLLLSAVIGARFATNGALITEQVPEARGTMAAISSSMVSLGMVVGPAVGGVLVDSLGFWAIGVFCAAVAAVSAAVVFAFVTEVHGDLEPG